MQPRVDVRPYIAMADWVVQLSNDMETFCYTTNEANSYGVPIVTTPLSVYKELPVTDNERIVLDWNCSNVNEIARLIFEKKVKPFEYTPPQDSWNKMLAKGKSTYEEEKNMKFKVEALDTYETRNISDKELGRIPKEGDTFEVTQERLDVLLGNNSYRVPFVKVLEEIKEQPKKPATKKTAKKTSKKEK